MSAKVYKELLEVMKKRRGNYAGADIPEFYAMVEELFTPEEAEINNAMPRGPVTAADLAKELEKDEEEVGKVLEGMANKGLCVAVKHEGTQFYNSAPFMPGIFEWQFMRGTTSERDKKIASLLHDYKTAYNSMTGPVEMTFPFTRVITVDKTVEVGNKVHTYDQVQSLIDKNDSIAVATCFCRHEAKLLGKDTHDMPMEVCMTFGPNAGFVVERLGGRILTKDEAREVIEKSEEAGLVHMTLNMTDEVNFMCNCDKWHCEPIQSVQKQARPALFFNSGFEPIFDEDECTACETCIDRCPPDALVLGDNDVPEVDLDRCFGCAVCATGCPADAVKMVAKPEFPAPPGNRKELGAALRAGANN